MLPVWKSWLRFIRELPIGEVVEEASLESRLTTCNRDIVIICKTIIIITLALVGTLDRNCLNNNWAVILPWTGYWGDFFEVQGIYCFPCSD